MSCSDKKIACLNCRNSKVKCVGGEVPSFNDSNLSIAQFPCERCAKTGVACNWKSSKKTGRPSKRAGNFGLFEAYLKGVPLIDSDSLEQTHDLVYHAALTISDNFKGADVYRNRESMLSLANEVILTRKCDLRSVVGLIYTIHDDYGGNNMDAGQYHLSYVCRVALELGLNTRTPNLSLLDPFRSIYGRIWWEVGVISWFYSS